MRKIAILHFSPPELYPPVQNFTLLLGDKLTSNDKLYLFTTKGIVPELTSFKSTNNNTIIVKYGKSGINLSPVKRYLYYIRHYVGVILMLIRIRPQKIFYYESISSFCAIIYKKFINTNVEVFAHYHEYSSPGEYKDGPALIKYFHRLEKKNYPSFLWISHTNHYRMELFLNDMKSLELNNTFVFPNYPPENWQTNLPGQISLPIKIVYAGACSLETMYCKEFAKWIEMHEGKMTLDIYSYNITSSAKNYFEKHTSNYIKIHSGLDYLKLPRIISKYDVGLIMYKGHIPNYIFNAPNKLFEYLTCGLDVWYPDVMVGCNDYKSDTLWPKVISLNFKKLDQYIPELLIQRQTGKQRFYSFTNEAACEFLINNLLK